MNGRRWWLYAFLGAAVWKVLTALYWRWWVNGSPPWARGGRWRR